MLNLKLLCKTNLNFVLLSALSMGQICAAPNPSQTPAQALGQFLSLHLPDQSDAKGYKETYLKKLELISIFLPSLKEWQAVVNRKASADQQSQFAEAMSSVTKPAIEGARKGIANSSPDFSPASSIRDAVLVCHKIYSMSSKSS